MVITKKGYGAFTHTPFDVYLRNLGVTTCIMTGVATSVCVETTTRQEVDLNYYMIVLRDATAEESIARVIPQCDRHIFWRCDDH